MRATVALTMTAGDAPSQSRDQSVEELGTVVTAQGLVVISASSIDPATAMDGRTVNMRGAPVKLAVTSEVKEARIILADGTEIPATVVYKDRDLNLAFLAPEVGAEEAKDAHFTPIDTAEEQALGVLDEVVVLSRLDKSMGRASAVECDFVRAVIAKPRRFLSIHLAQAGLPVFALGGKFAGFTTVRFSSSGDAEGSPPRRSFCRRATCARPSRPRWPGRRPPRRSDLPPSPAETFRHSHALIYTDVPGRAHAPEDEEDKRLMSLVASGTMKPCGCWCIAITPGWWVTCARRSVLRPPPRSWRWRSSSGCIGRPAGGAPRPS